MKFDIKEKTVQEINGLVPEVFPKYTTQLMNLANQNAGATRPKQVGQMSELFPEYVRTHTDISRKGWEEYYLETHQKQVQEAVKKVLAQIQNLKNAIDQIDENMVERWIKDLLINKTYDGMYIQKAIFVELSKMKNESFRMATPEEEALNIDGFVGDIPYSVKPESYKMMDRLPGKIPCKMIYYTKGKTKTSVEVEE